MADAADIEAELKSDGYEIDGVTAWDDEFYAVGFEASDLPNSVLNKQPVDDPALKK